MSPHSNAVAMIDLYYAIPGGQCPWKFPKWIATTGLKGLFGPDDEYHPSEWSPGDTEAVKTYFEAYLAKPTIDAKLSFAGARTSDDYRGRVLWKDFIAKNWKNWKVQSAILDAFAQKSITYTQIMVANDMNDLPDTIPFSVALDQIAFSLFGADALDANGVVKHFLRRPISTLAVNASQNLRSATKSLVKRVRVRKEKIDDLLAVVASSDATMQGVKELTKLVGAWKKDINIWPSPANLEALSDVEGELAGIMLALGGTMDWAPGQKKPGKKVIRRNTKALAKLEGDAAAEALAMLVEHFADDEDIPELFQSINVDFGGLEEGMDPGVAYEATKSFEELCSHLGYDSHGCSPMFNAYRHTGAKRATPTSDPALFEAFRKLGQAHTEASSFEAIAFHYHQVQGTHSIARQFFTDRPSPKNPMGVVIADAPGLGKTAMAIASIVFLISVGLRQDKGLSLPPLVGARPYFGESPLVPNLCSLIIAPGTLTAQWKQEFHVFVKSGVIAIFLYPTSKPARSKFFAEDGPFATSAVPLRNRVIIATQSTLFTEFRDLYQQPNDQEKRDFPWSLPGKKLVYDAKAGSTLFGREYLSVVLDEAHFCRNPGPTHWGPLALMQKAKSRLIMTATPVQTRVEDIGAMGRLANLSHFSSQAFADEVAADAAELRRAKQNDPSTMRTLQLEASRRMQLQFAGALICRSVDSKDFNGDPLLSLPEKKVYHVHFQLKPWESEFVDKSLTQEAFEQMAMAKMQGIQTESLFSNERLTVTFPRENRKEPLPKVGSKRVWKDLGEPTKITGTKDLAVYLLLGDDAPAPIVGEGGITYPPYAPSPTTARTRKILIYQEFPVYSDLLRDVLGVYGVRALALNGSMTYPARERVVKLFKISTDYRCLIISKVGAVGLNLTDADTLIFLDQQWSYADENQAIGRIFRQGQKRPVSIYHILAAGTVDYYMSMLARGKALISMAFLTTEKQKKLGSFLEGGDVALGVDGDDDEVEDLPSTTKGKKAKALIRKRSAVPIAALASGKDSEDIVAPSEAPSEPAAPPPEGEKKKKKKKKKKSKATVPTSESDSHRAPEASTHPTNPDSPPATEKKVKKKKASKKAAPPETVDDSEPERERTARLHRRAPNRKVVLDMSEENTTPRAAVGDEDIAMRTASDSDAFMSIPSLPPLSSRSSSKVPSEYSAAGASIVSNPHRKEGRVPGVSEYSSDSEEDPAPKPRPKPVKRDRSDSQQVAGRSGIALTKRQKQPAHPSPEPEPEPEPDHIFFAEPNPPSCQIATAEDWEDFARGGDYELPPSDEDLEPPPPQPPFTQRAPASAFAQKSSSMEHLAQQAAADLMQRRSLGGRDATVRGRGPSSSAGASSAAGGASPRKIRSGLGRPGSSQSRSGVPKFENPFGGSKKNPFASSSKQGGS